MMVVGTLVMCVLILSTQSAAIHVSIGPEPPNAASLPPPAPWKDNDRDVASSSGANGRVAVTIRSEHSGKYWQVLGDNAPGATLQLSASALPHERGLERTVFLLEREGDLETDGWLLLRWLKTRQLVEAVPPGVPGRQGDAWSVRLSDAVAVNELHKFIVEDDATHSRSHIWSVALRGLLLLLNAAPGSHTHASKLRAPSSSHPTVIGCPPRQVT